MSTLAEAFSAGQEAVLRAAPALATAMGLTTARLYTVVPPDAPLPYVVLGDDQILGDDTDCAEGAEIFATVHVWAKPNPPSSALARQIGGALKTILTAAFAVAGYVLDDWTLETETYVTDPDGSTHGRLVFKYLVTSTAG